MAQILRGQAGELFYTCAADVRAALASTDVPSNARLFADLAAEEADRAARSSEWSDVDIDADLPLPVDCLGEWTQTSTAAGRLRAVQMHQLARFALVRILRRDDGAESVDAALQYGEKPRRHHGAGEDAVTVIPHEPLVQVLERLTEPEDYLSLNATMRTRLGTARRETGRALAAFLGLPQTLSATVAGNLPFNRIDRLLYRVVNAQLTVSEMNAVDDMAMKMRPEVSLDQFERRIREFIRDSFDPAVRSPESIHRDRGLRLVPEPDGSGTLVIHGPILPLKLSYERVRATARAMRRQELAGLNIQAGDMSQEDAESALETLDDRTIEQYMFDLAVGAVPQTDVRVVRVAAGQTREAGGGDEATDENPGAEDAQQESFMATVACPTDGAWLRKQAAVTVTMSLSTLMGMGNESATLDHSTPLPAEQARQVAAKATVWHRILYDPATGTITDEATRTYAPTAAMRRAVEHKWRSCMAPGCTRSSTLCEIDHCEAFCHDDPGRGGPTHPCNLIPLCVTHHQLKTNGVIRLRRVSADEVEWILPLGVVTRTVAPPADPSPRHSTVAEEVLGVRLRSADFCGTAVDELLHGKPRRTDLFGGMLITVVLPRTAESAGGSDEQPGEAVVDDDPPPF